MSASLRKARVVCADLNGSAARDTAAALGEAAVSVTCDVADAAATNAAVVMALQHFGAVDVLVNNAAMWIADSTVETIPLEDWNRTLAVNLTGAVLMSRAVLGPMRRAGGGSIIHIASQLGHVGKAGRFWYCTAKAALIHLARCMAIDHAADGIRVNSLSPGPVATDRIVRRAGGAEAALALYAPLTLFKRPGRVQEIASAALYLASDEASFMTGSDLLVDGGYVAR